MIITRKSPFSGKINKMDINVTAGQIVRWEMGELIQNAMPNLTPSEREFIKTGITDEEWQAACGE
jgi:hypothetical protein